jgi:hypothetical protein
MTNKHTAWDFSAEVSVSYTMSPVIWLAARASSNNSIPELVGGSRENPTSRKGDANNTI